MAVGCSHGDLASPDRLNEVLSFRERFKPEIRFDLGDIMDTAAFRTGAKGTKDQSQKIAPDNLAAVEWMRRYEPTHITWGNHDWRLRDWQEHPDAVTSFAAGIVWGALQDEAKRLRAWQLPYANRKAFKMGGVYWTHGTMHGENALRDHAEQFGGPVVMAHIHRAETTHGRTVAESGSFAVGTLANVDKMSYAERMRSKNRWSAGVVFGEICETGSKLWLARNLTQDEIEPPSGDLFRRPTGVDGWKPQIKISNPIQFPPGC